MSVASVERRRLAGGLWWWLVALVFTSQVALIFLLSDNTPHRPRAAGAAPVLHLAGSGSAELLALKDPTLFALPHAQGFSGRGWLRAPRPKFPMFSWWEPPRWLSLPVQQLGETFNQFMKTNEVELTRAPIRPEPELTQPETIGFAVRARSSSLRVEGPLGDRRLMTPLALKSWPHTDLLGNSVVEVVVDANGRPISAKLLLPSSGSLEADQHALEQARSARFEPVRTGPERAAVPSRGLTWGKMVFQWNTLVATNAPAP